MAYRKIHDDFWTDPDIEELTPEQKYFYLYLITNPSVNQLGLYEFSFKRACFETGYNEDTVNKLLEIFEEKGKIKRSSTTKELLVVKFYHHNKSNSPKVKKHIEGLITEVKDTSLIGYVYGMDTLSQEEEEKEEKEEENNNKKNLGTSNEPTIVDKIRQVQTVSALAEIWFSVLKERQKWPDLAQQEIISHKMNQWGLDKSKMIVSLSVQNGWKSLSEKYLPEGVDQNACDIEAPNATAYQDDYTSL